MRYSKQAAFNIGQIVYHQLLGYRAVVVDVDPRYIERSMVSEGAVELPNYMLDKPWYVVLVDDSEQEDYVSECYLTKDQRLQPVNNPKLHNYFDGIDKGRYQAITWIN